MTIIVDILLLVLFLIDFRSLLALLLSLSFSPFSARDEKDRECKTSHEKRLS
jgi:hypothetical protein